MYGKGRNVEAAQHLTLQDIEHTDLADILRAIKNAAQEARNY
jgi:hypothetical protein